MQRNVKNFDSIQPARLLIWLLKLSGMWHFEGKSWNSFYRLYGCILHFNFTLLFIAGMYINVGTAATLDDLSDGLYMSLTETALLVKVFNAMRKHKKTVAFVQLFEKYFEGRPSNDEEVEIVRKCHKGYTYLRNAFMAGSFIVVTSSYITPMIKTSYELPFPCWMPYDYRNERNFYYAYAFVCIGMMVTAVSNCTLDLFQAYLLLQLAIYYKILGNRFRNFGNKSKGDEITLKKYFDFHNFVTRLTSECESFLSFPVFVQIVLSAFVICFTVYRLQYLNFIASPSEFIMLVTFAFVMALQIYLPCSYGHELTMSYSELTFAVYESGWADLSLGMRKKLFIFMEYLKHPVIVKAGKIFNIGLGVFSQTMNNAYRLYALLLNIDS